MLIYKGLITHLATGILPTHFIKNRQNPSKVEFQGIILKFSKRNKILLLLPQNAKFRHFPILHEVVERWQRKVQNRLRHERSCWFAHYTCSIFDILIAVALLDLKVPINLIKDYRGEGPSLKEREA